MSKVKWSWVVLIMLFVATGLNFLDRQVLSIVIIKIQEEFNMSNVQYGMINTSFLIGYGIMFTVAGRLIDTVGSKAGLGASVAVWSVANCLHGAVNSFHQLLGSRLLLGLGEGGCFPGAAKTVSEWFNIKQRGLANGVAIGGAAIGAVISPPLTIYLSASYGWRWSFVIPGLIGVVWVTIWLMLPKPPKAESSAGDSQLTSTKPIPFLFILKNRNALIFIIIRFLLDPVVYFIMFWVPKYLNEERSVSFERIGELFWIPFLALGISNIMGGWFSDKLVAANFSVNKARKTVMGIAAALTLTVPFITSVSTAEIAVGLMALFMFAHGFWITNYITAINDVFGNRGTATVVGLSGTAGTLSSLLINPMIGLIVENYSYSPLWLVAGFLYPVAFILFVIFIPKIKLLPMAE
jgi:ACS family hexuronate transporter-like MFS transporter